MAISNFVVLLMDETLPIIRPAYPCSCSCSSQSARLKRKLALRTSQNAAGPRSPDSGAENPVFFGVGIRSCKRAVKLRFVLRYTWPVGFWGTPWSRSALVYGLQGTPWRPIRGARCWSVYKNGSMVQLFPDLDHLSPITFQNARQLCRKSGWVQATHQSDQHHCHPRGSYCQLQLRLFQQCHRWLPGADIFY